MLPMAMNCVLLSLALGTPEAATAGANPRESVNVAFERYRLENGLEVILHEDHSAPIVAVVVWYHVGSGNETPGKSGFAHLFEHMMFQGAKHIGADVHFELLKKIGGTGINGTTNPDRTNYFEIVPAHHLETALWLESDRMGYLLDLLDENSLENQRDVVRNERRQNYDNRPFGREQFALAEALYPEGHPYRHLTIGRHEDVEGGSLADVRDFFLRWYVPSNATLTLAGDFDSAQAKGAIEKWFGSFPQAPEPKATPVAAPVLEKSSRVEITDPFVRHERVHYAWHSPPAFGDGDLELEMLAGAIGAEGWGRLYKALVLEAGLAQRVSAYQDANGHSGAFHVVVDLQPGADRARAEKLLQAEIQRVMQEPLAKVELDRIAARTESNFVWGLEELSSRANRLQWFNHYTGDPGHAEQYLKRVRGVTAERALAAAKKWLGKPRVELITRPGATK